MKLNILSLSKSHAQITRTALQLFATHYNYSSDELHDYTIDEAIACLRTLITVTQREACEHCTTRSVAHFTACEALNELEEQQLQSQEREQRLQTLDEISAYIDRTLASLQRVRSHIDSQRLSDIVREIDVTHALNSAHEVQTHADALECAVTPASVNA